MSTSRKIVWRPSETELRIIPCIVLCEAANDLGLIVRDSEWAIFHVMRLGVDVFETPQQAIQCLQRRVDALKDRYGHVGDAVAERQPPDGNFRKRAVRILGADGVWTEWCKDDHDSFEVYTYE